MSFIPQTKAQNTSEKPRIIYGQPRNLEIGGISVEGVKGYEDYVLIGLSGLTVGERIDIPGDEVTEAVERMWKHGLFWR
jgi:outer membrane protein insertion porin family